MLLLSSGTAYLGKYLNEYKGQRVPPGWSHWYTQLGNSKYYNYTMVVGNSTNRQGQISRKIKFQGAEGYFTSVLLKETKRVLDDRLRRSESSPLFMVVSLPAPHGTAEPEPKYSHRFANVKVPRWVSMIHAFAVGRNCLLEMMVSREEWFEFFQSSVHLLSL